jgi:hypothetical protein
MKDCCIKNRKRKTGSYKDYGYFENPRLDPPMIDIYEYNVFCPICGYKFKENE